ncbi:TerB family tellurite resistance protein [Phenylobacterium sp. J367]|uniref:TerB family tellurite resistance protein n=1 Tax=Phenylobacterium sp. J367 TaxID=2898435 RepID=UPI00215074F8|nr:TerB family tellurite resistance protein [Phenylobacterium sp. J367]MCR5881266.1 TerB family tellurite resistance protein [Phenylobacterium sp. J367]
MPGNRRDYEAVRTELPQPSHPVFGPALAAACAMVASADGWPSDEERTQLLQRMRLLAAGGTLDLNGLVETFDGLLEALLSDPGKAEARCLALIEPLSEEPDLRLALAHACNAVAMADGGYDEAERNVALRICRAIKVAPEEIGIESAR